MATVSTSAGVLTGWKEIAAYLGRGVRTVQRYELALDMPVRRVNGCVIAYPNELDHWLKASSTEEAPHFEGVNVYKSNVLERHRRAMRTLHQNLNSMMETIAKISHRLEAVEEIRSDHRCFDFRSQEFTPKGTSWRTTH